MGRRGLLDVAPVLAEAYFGDDGDGEGGGGLHLGFDKLLHLFGFSGDDVEEEFVVDLEGHEGTEFTAGDFGVDAEHGDLDEVGGSALQRRVDGSTFGEAALVGIAGLDVGDGADAAEGGANLLRAADFFERGFNERCDAGVAGEVAVDVFAGGLLIDA